MCSILSKAHIVDIEYAQGICLPIFVAEEFSGLFAHPSIFLIKDSKSVLISLIILSLISSFSFFNLKRSLILSNTKLLFLYFLILIMFSADCFFPLPSTVLRDSGVL